VDSGSAVTPDTGLTVSVAAGTVFVAGTSYSPTAGTVTVTGASSTDRKDLVVYTVGTGYHVVAGTPCGTGGWVRSSANPNYPVKPAVPANSVALAEIYVEGTGGTPTTSIGSGNIVDKRALGGFTGSGSGNTSQKSTITEAVPLTDASTAYVLAFVTCTPGATGSGTWDLSGAAQFNGAEGDVDVYIVADTEGDGAHPGPMSDAISSTTAAASFTEVVVSAPLPATPLPAAITETTVYDLVAIATQAGFSAQPTSEQGAAAATWIAATPTVG